MNWGERLGVEVEALMVLRRGEAMEEGVANIVRQARAVYFVGDQPLHLKSVMKDTPLFEAFRDVLVNGGLVVATGGSRRRCATRWSTLPRRLPSPWVSAWCRTWRWSPRPRRGRRSACTAPVRSPTPPSRSCTSGDALVRTAGGWEQLGRPEVFGDLP